MSTMSHFITRGRQQVASAELVGLHDAGGADTGVDIDARGGSPPLSCPAKGGAFSGLSPFVDPVERADPAWPHPSRVLPALKPIAGQLSAGAR
jgi:hypothetical protein